MGMHVDVAKKIRCRICLSTSMIATMLSFTVRVFQLRHIIELPREHKKNRHNFFIVCIFHFVIITG